MAKKDDGGTATVSVNGGPEVPLDTLERAVERLERQADEITGTPNTLQIGQRALWVMDAFPEEGDRGRIVDRPGGARPGTDNIPEFLTKLVLDRQLGLGL